MLLHLRLPRDSKASTSDYLQNNTWKKKKLLTFVISASALSTRASLQVHTAPSWSTPKSSSNFMVASADGTQNPNDCSLVYT